MGAGISLSKKQIDAIVERHRIQMSFDNYIHSVNPYIDGWYVHEDFSVEEKYWKDLHKINLLIYRESKQYP